MMKMINYKINRKSNDTIYLETNQQEKRYSILEKFEFTSERKRMSVIVKLPGSERILMLTKGADTMME